MVLSCFIIRSIIHKALITDPLNNDCGSLLGVTFRGFRGCHDEPSKDRSSRLPSLANGVGPISASSWMHGNGACNKSEREKQPPWLLLLETKHIQIDHDIPVTSDFLARHSVGAVKCNLITCRVLCKAQCEDRYMHFYTPSYSGIRQELPSWSAIGPWLNHHNAPQFQGPIRVFGRPWFRHGLQMIVGQMTESNTLPND
jgi:hypothetical protein